MKYLVYLVCAAQIAAFILFALHFGDTPEVAGSGRVTAFGLVLALFMVPALILAVTGGSPWAALALTLGPPALIGLAVAGT